MAKLQRIALKGFKSIKSLDLELGSMNLLLGANGAGKSNFISFFKLLNEMMAGRLQQHIGVTGRAHSILHYGPKVTPQIEATLEFELENGKDTYEFRLSHAAGDSLIFAEERLRFLATGRKQPQLLELGAGHQETRIREEAESGAAIAEAFRILLNSCRVFHFHDTSPTARVRQHCYVGDNHVLLPDAGNLAAFLLRLREENGGTAYRRIVVTLRLLAPFFADFDLQPEGPGQKDVILNWREVSSDQVFGPHQLSDGTLRAACLISLLLQPVASLPDLIVVDEPELGLHPFALQLVASLFKKAAHHTRIIVSTQSTAFLDACEPEDIIVVDRRGKESVFSRPERQKLEEWLEAYSLGEIWEKNVFGGGPH